MDDDKNLYKSQLEDARAAAKPKKIKIKKGSARWAN
jgi:hypothetical protein